MESMQIIEERAINEQSFPLGSPIRSILPSNAVGDLLQVHEFLCRFQEVLGLEEPLTFEELEKELLCQCPEKENHDDLSNTVGESSIMETVERNCDKLTVVHRALLCRLASYAKELDMLPINQLTWPEVIQRFLMAYLITGGRLDYLKDAVKNNNNKLIRCLLGDSGICCGSPTGVAGVDLDAQLLGRAVNKVFGKLIRERNTSLMGNADGGMPEWVKVLEPAKKLRTNVGSRIRNCVYEALNKSPPEWAKKKLEESISKGLYKGNACGPTKRAVIEVLDRASKDEQMMLPPDMDVTRSELISKVTMKKCRSMLRHVAAGYDTKKVFCNLVGRNFNSNDNKTSIIFGSASTRPLDLRTIDFRILHGTYGGSDEAFLEDVRELWNNLGMNRHSLVELAGDVSKEFESRYENEVATLLKKLFEYKDNKFIVEAEELEELSRSIEIPEAPWDSGICKVCGINKNDKYVLLCDTVGCDAEYHTYCLNPPISDIPEGNWYCPTCAPPKEPLDNDHLLQLVDKSWEEGRQILDIATALEETDYRELEADKKIFLLKFLCLESLHTPLIHEILVKSRAKVCLENKFLGIDSVGRLYWGFPDASTYRGIVVNEKVPLENPETSPTDLPASHAQSQDSGTWRVFKSDEEMSNLVDYLRSDPDNIHLRASIVKWQKLFSQSGQPTETNSVERDCSTDLKKSPFPDCFVTKATELLQAKHGLYMEHDANIFVKKPRKNVAKWYRCACLEPILPCRYHCSTCHQTFFTNVLFEHHNNCTRGGASSSVDMSKVDVASSREEGTTTSDNSRKSMPSEFSGKLVEDQNDTFSYDDSNKKLVEIGASCNPPDVPSASTSITNPSAVVDHNQGLVLQPGISSADQIAISLAEEITSTSCNDGLRAVGPDGAHAANKIGVDCLKPIGSSNVLSDAGRSFVVPESSLKPVMGKARHILRQLKINLLDMEAALPDGAKRPSRASPELRSAWCAFVKSADTIYEMVEATLLLETMIETQYIKNSWWWYWSSVSIAAKTSNMYALAFRIHMLDATINYHETTTTCHNKQSMEMNVVSENAKEQSKRHRTH